MSEDKKNNVFYINHSGELLIWLVIVLIIAIYIFFIKIHKPISKNEYNIFMPDVDGLIIGSPVKTMGIEIGYITKIKPVEDEVFITFVISNNDVKLPQGTVATVEFSGLAGSRSLELYLPDENTYIDSTVPYIKVDPPKRLNEAVGLLNEMFKKVGNIITISSRFGRKLGEIEFPIHNNSKSTKDFLDLTNKMIDDSQEKIDNLGSALNEYKNNK